MPRKIKSFRLPQYIFEEESEYVVPRENDNLDDTDAQYRRHIDRLDEDMMKFQEHHDKDEEDFVEYLDRRLEEMNDDSDDDDDDERNAVSSGPRGSASFRLPAHILNENDDDFEYESDDEVHSIREDDFDYDVPTVVRTHKDPNAAKGFRLPGHILPETYDDFDYESDNESDSDLDPDFVAKAGARRNAIHNLDDNDFDDNDSDDVDNDSDDDEFLDDDFVAESGGRRNAVSRGDLSSGPRRRNAILPPIVPSHDEFDDEFDGFATANSRDGAVPVGLQDDEFVTAEFEELIDEFEDLDGVPEQAINGDDDDEFAEALEEEIEQAVEPSVEPSVEPVVESVVEPVSEDVGSEVDAFATAREEEFYTPPERVINPLTPEELNRVGCMPGRDGTIVVGRRCPLSVSSTEYPFTFMGETFFTVEQFMFAEKAKAFDDMAMYRKIMGFSEILIRSTSNFRNLMGRDMAASSGGWAGEQRWSRMRMNKLYHANALKFSGPGNNAAAEFLMKTGDRGLRLSYTTLSDFVGYDEILLRIRTFLRERAGV